MDDHYWNPGKCGQTCKNADHAKLEAAREPIAKKTFEKAIAEEEKRHRETMAALHHAQYDAEQLFDKLCEKDRDQNAARSS